MAKSKYREKQERGLVPSRYPTRQQMLGAWQHWPQHALKGDARAVGKSIAHEGRNDLRPRREGHHFIEPHRPIV